MWLFQIFLFLIYGQAGTIHTYRDSAANCGLQQGRAAQKFTTHLKLWRCICPDHKLHCPALPSPSLTCGVNIHMWILSFFLLPSTTVPLCCKSSSISSTDQLLCLIISLCPIINVANDILNFKHIPCLQSLGSVPHNNNYSQYFFIHLTPQTLWAQVIRA